MSQIPTPDRRLVKTAAVLVGAIACGAFVVSYSALYSLALAANIVHPLAVIYPFLVDGFIAVASLAAVVLRGRSGRSTWYPWMLLVLFFAFSVLGNAVHANARHGIPQLSPFPAAAVSAVPPIALGLAFHLLLRMVTDVRATSPAQRQVSGRLHNGRDLESAALRALDDARRDGLQLTGAMLARHLGVSDRHGRRLLAEVSSKDTA